MKSKAILYYTENKLGDPIFSAVQKQIMKSGLPIVSVSLKPIKFGHNIVLNLQPGVVTMFEQIMAGLKASTAETIFFCEHDVLYHPSHFDFEPPRDDVFFYNSHVWRWPITRNYAITFDGLRSVSGLCANRELLIRHYIKRLEIAKKGWRRQYGWEPGVRKVRQGGISDEDFSEWRAAYPNVDIRHEGSLTSLHSTLSSFQKPHHVRNWREIRIDEIPGWNLKEMFKLN